MITYGTNPGMGMAVTAHIPTTEGMESAEQSSFEKSMQYMGFQAGESLLGKKSITFFWAHVPMDESRISVLLPLS